VVMAPSHAQGPSAGSMPGDLMLEYYRNGSDGGLIVSEGTSISIAAEDGLEPRHVFGRAGWGMEETYPRVRPRSVVTVLFHPQPARPNTCRGSKPSSAAIESKSLQKR